MSRSARPDDWFEWHAAYDRESSLRQRLEVVRMRLTQALDERPPGPVRIVSICAGQGRDVLPVIAVHPRRGDIVARLVELDPRNVEVAAASARAKALDRVEILECDAARSASYAGAVPADIVLTCGVFGNITDEDIAATIDRIPMLCAPGATVIWTRGRTEPDLTPAIRSWFEQRGYIERSFDGETGSFGVGVHRLAVQPDRFEPDVVLFTFLGWDELRDQRSTGARSSSRNAGLRKP